MGINTKLGHHSRPYPADGYKQEQYEEETIHITMRLSQKDHLAICAKLPSRRMNRTEWIEEAIKEKLQRENN